MLDLHGAGQLFERGFRDGRFERSEFGCVDRVRSLRGPLCVEFGLELRLGSLLGRQAFLGQGQFAFALVEFGPAPLEIGLGLQVAPCPLGFNLLTLGVQAGFERQLLGHHVLVRQGVELFEFGVCLLKIRLDSLATVGPLGFDLLAVGLEPFGERLPLDFQIQEGLGTKLLDLGVRLLAVLELPGGLFLFGLGLRLGLLLFGRGPPGDGLGGFLVAQQGQFIFQRILSG